MIDEIPITIEYLLDNQENFNLFCKTVLNEVDPYNLDKIDSSKFENCVSVMNEYLTDEEIKKEDYYEIFNDMDKSAYLNLEDLSQLIRMIFENKILKNVKTIEKK